METKTFDGNGKVIGTQVSSEQQNSVEISMNAKGEKSWKVKVYEDNPEKMQEALKKFIEIAKLHSKVFELAVTYPTC